MCITALGPQSKVTGLFVASSINTTDLEPNVMDEIRLSQIVEVSPPRSAVEAMQAAIIQWHYEEPKTERA